MTRKKRKKSTGTTRVKPASPRGCGLSLALLALSALSFLWFLFGLALLGIRVYPAWQALVEKLPARILMAFFWIIPALDPLGIIIIVLMSVFALASWLCCLDLWRRRRRGLYGFLVLEGISVTFGVLSLFNRQLPEGILRQTVTVMEAAGRFALISLLPVIILWFLLRPQWKRMR